MDDYDLFRVGLVAELAELEDVEVVAQASGGKMAVRLAGELRPDVVLMDVRLPDLDGLAATEAILKQNESTRVVALTVMAEQSDIEAAVAAGACGYLLKDSPIADVAAAIRAAASGTSWLSPRAAQALLEHMKREHVQAKYLPVTEHELSPREIEVLRLLAQGLENNEIADHLSISPRTVRNHVSSILNKLGVTNRIQAAIYAVRRGIA